MNTEIKTEYLDTQIPACVTRAQSLKITTHDEYVVAVEFGKSIKKLMDEVVSTFREPKDLASKTHKSICAQEKRHLDPLDQAIRIARKVCGDWQLLQDQLKKQAALDAQKAAQLIADEQMRVDAAAKEESRLKEAVALDALGYKDEAEAILAIPVIATPVAPIISTPIEIAPKVKGTSSQKKYEYEITDESLIPRQFLMVNEKLIGNQVRAFGPDFACPGIKVFETRQVSFSGK